MAKLLPQHYWRCSSKTRCHLIAQVACSHIDLVDLSVVYIYGCVLFLQMEMQYRMISTMIIKQKYLLSLISV